MISTQHNGKLKMIVRLFPDGDGYPPVAAEGLWVSPLTASTVVLDNIPFYAKGIAPGDELTVRLADDDEIWFENVAKSGGASVFRIHAENDETIVKIRNELRAIGLATELNEAVRLIAVEVPPESDITLILDYLVDGVEAGRFDYEEGVLRHTIPE